MTYSNTENEPPLNEPPPSGRVFSIFHGLKAQHAIRLRNTPLRITLFMGLNFFDNASYLQWMI